MSERIQIPDSISEVVQPYQHHLLHAALVNRDKQQFLSLAKPMEISVMQDLPELFAGGHTIDFRVDGTDYKISSVDQYNAIMESAVGNLAQLESSIPAPEKAAGASPLAALEVNSNTDSSAKEKLATLVQTIEGGEYTTDTLKYSVMGTNNSVHSDEAVTDQGKKGLAQQSLKELAAVTEGANASLAENIYKKRCAACASQFEDLVNTIRSTSGITDMSLSAETEHAIKACHNFAERGDPRLLHDAITNFLLYADRKKDKDPDGASALLALLGTSTEAASQDSVAEELGTSRKKRGWLMSKVFGERES